MPDAQLMAGLDPLFHPLANLFPMMGPGEHAELVEDVRVRGIRNKIVLHEGKILDGRNRYLAGIAAGRLTPGVFEMPGGGEYLPDFRAFIEEHDGKPLDFVLSTNLHRRHLSESQRAMVAAKLEGYRHGGARSDGAADQDANLPVESIALTRSEAAEIAKVSPRSVASAKVVIEHGAPELAEKVDRGEVAVSLAAELARLPVDEQREVMRNADPAALYKVVKEQHAIRQQAKKARRAEREQQLGEKIAEANAALPAMVAAGKRYGLIIEDSEWPWTSYSEETGMDRAEENHYPTSSLEEICARPIGDLAADDCVYLLWATPSRLLMAIDVMKARGFVYKTSFVWKKLLPGKMPGRGYWARFIHEYVLIGVKGSPPCPALGEQWDSLFEAPRGANSVKPPTMHEWAERFYPNVPKLECNAREAREGWDVWGAEAPDAVTIGVDLAAGPDVSAEVLIDGDGTLSVQIDDAGEDEGGEPDRDDGGPDEEELAPKAKGSRKAKAPKRDPWREERDARAARKAELAQELPADLDALTAAYGAAIDLHHDAVMREDAEATHAQRERMDAILFKANDCSDFGVGSNDAPTSVFRANWAPVGTIPKWGQVGQFIVEHREIRAIICFGVHEGIHAVAFNRPFPSETGFHSIGAVRTPGMTVEEYGRAMLDGALAYVPGGGKGKPRKPVLPESAYRLALSERGYLQPRERGEMLTPEFATAAGVDLGLLDVMAAEWQADDRARLIGERKGKRVFPDCRGRDRRIVAIEGGLLLPQADFPLSGAYLVSDFRWEGSERIEFWRYVADAALLDEGVA